MLALAGGRGALRGRGLHDLGPEGRRGAAARVAGALGGSGVSSASCWSRSWSAGRGPISDCWDEFRTEDAPVAGGRPRRAPDHRGREPQRHLELGDRRVRGRSRCTGVGAGTFEFWWLSEADDPEYVRDAHSLYLEHLAELGLPGALLLVTALGGLLAIALAARRKLERPGDLGASVALTSAFAVFLVNAGVDWMWEETAVAVLAIGGVAVAAAGGSTRRTGSRRRGVLLKPGVRVALVAGGRVRGARAGAGARLDPAGAGERGRPRGGRRDRRAGARRAGGRRPVLGRRAARAARPRRARGRQPRRGPGRDRGGRRSRAGELGMAPRPGDDPGGGRRPGRRRSRPSRDGRELAPRLRFYSPFSVGTGSASTRTASSRRSTSAARLASRRTRRDAARAIVPLIAIAALAAAGSGCDDSAPASTTAAPDAARRGAPPGRAGARRRRAERVAPHPAARDGGRGRRAAGVDGSAEPAVRRRLEHRRAAAPRPGPRVPLRAVRRHVQGRRRARDQAAAGRPERAGLGRGFGDAAGELREQPADGRAPRRLGGVRRRGRAPLSPGDRHRDLERAEPGRLLGRRQRDGAARPRALRGAARGRIRRGEGGEPADAGDRRGAFAHPGDDARRRRQRDGVPGGRAGGGGGRAHGRAQPPPVPRHGRGAADAPADRRGSRRPRRARGGDAALADRGRGHDHRPGPGERARAGAPAGRDLPLGHPPAGRRRALRPQPDRAAPARRRVRDRVRADAGAARRDAEGETRLRGAAARVPGGAGLRGRNERRARPRLPARHARRRAHLRRDRGLLARRRRSTPRSTAATAPAGASTATRIHTSCLQRLGVRQRGFRLLLPLLPARGRAPAGRRPRAGRLVEQRLRARRPAGPGRGARLLLPHPVPLRVARARARARRGAAAAAARARARCSTRIRRWDLEAAGPGHALRRQLAPGRRSASRDLYGRESAIIHPPGRGRPVHARRAARTTSSSSASSSRHKRSTSRSRPRAQAGKPIKVVGTAPSSPRLRAPLRASAEFLGRVGDDELARLYARRPRAASSPRSRSSGSPRSRPRPRAAR